MSRCGVKNKVMMKGVYKRRILIETFKFDNELSLLCGGKMMYFNNSLIFNITRQQYDEDFKIFNVHKNRFRG